MTFDKHGHLIPYESIPSDLTTLKTFFVNSFDRSVTRRKIFDAFTLYLMELQFALNVSVEIWVNGSFITQKRDPNDIDFVIFVNKQIATIHRDTMYQFRERRYAKDSLTDGYFVETVPNTHPDFALYQFDRQDWYRAFVFGRKEQKGYLQLLL